MPVCVSEGGVYGMPDHPNKREPVWFTAEQFCVSEEVIGPLWMSAAVSFIREALKGKLIA